MSHPNALLRRRFAGALAGAMFLAAGAPAQTHNDYAQGTNQIPGLAVTLMPGEVVGHEQVIRQVIRRGTNEFMFVVPDELRTQPPSGGATVLTSHDRSCYVSIRIVEPAPAESGLKEALRERIAGEYPQMADLEEISTTVAEREGTGFQLRQKLPGVGARLIRVIWVPFKAGVLEFTLNVEAASAPAGQGTFDMILVTFRSNERGTIEVVKRSEQT